jgi:hypothetical protein
MVRLTSRRSGNEVAPTELERLHKYTLEIEGKFPVLSRDPETDLCQGACGGNPYELPPEQRGTIASP